MPTSSTQSRCVQADLVLQFLPHPRPDRLHCLCRRHARPAPASGPLACPSLPQADCRSVLPFCRHNAKSRPAPPGDPCDETRPLCPSRHRLRLCRCATQRLARSTRVNRDGFNMRPTSNSAGWQGDASSSSQSLVLGLRYLRDVGPGILERGQLAPTGQGNWFVERARPALSGRHISLQPGSRGTLHPWRSALHWPC
jgi:hypothetical protein